MKKLILCAVLVALTGCASLPAGLLITKELTDKCATQRCIISTMDDLSALGEYAYTKGFERGFIEGYVQGAVEAEASKPKGEGL